MDENEISSIFEKNSNLKECYTEILLNSTSIIVVNEYMKYYPYMKKNY